MPLPGRFPRVGRRGSEIAGPVPLTAPDRVAVAGGVIRLTVPFAYLKALQALPGDDPR